MSSFDSFSMWKLQTCRRIVKTKIKNKFLNVFKRRALSILDRLFASLFFLVAVKKGNRTWNWKINFRTWFYLWEDKKNNLCETLLLLFVQWFWFWNLISTPKCDEAYLFLVAARDESTYVFVAADVKWFVAWSVTGKDESWLHNVNISIFAKWTSRPFPDLAATKSSSRLAELPAKQAVYSSGLFTLKKSDALRSTFSPGR